MYELVRKALFTAEGDVRRISGETRLALERAQQGLSQLEPEVQSLLGVLLDAMARAATVAGWAQLASAMLPEAIEQEGIDVTLPLTD